MLSEGQKRRASLSILEKLRGKGVPEKGMEEADGEFDSMFATLSEEGKIESGQEKKPSPPEEEADEVATPPLPISASPAKKKGPNLNPGKTKEFMKSFKGMK